MTVLFCCIFCFKCYLFFFLPENNYCNPTFFSRWGQVFILDALSRYKAEDAREAENIMERVTPRLQHANCAVVLSAVKVNMFLHHIDAVGFEKSKLFHLTNILDLFFYFLL